MHGSLSAPDRGILSLPQAALQRSSGRVDLRFVARGSGTAPVRLYEQGALKARLTRRSSDASGAVEAVIINAAGGLTGGDHVTAAVTVGDHAAVTITSQGCERIYRSVAGDARVETVLTIDAGARLHWLPQPTILFEASRLNRTTTVDLARGSRLLALEALIFGRTAMGEVVRSGAWRDAWTVRRDGRLVFADAFRLDDASVLSSRFAFAGNRAVATLIYGADDAAARLPDLRQAIDTAFGKDSGASAWNGLLVARMLAPDGYALTQGLMKVLAPLRDLPMPRAWML